MEETLENCLSSVSKQEYVGGGGVFSTVPVAIRGALRDKPGHGDTWGGGSAVKPVSWEDSGSRRVLHFLQYHTAELVRSPRVCVG